MFYHAHPNIYLLIYALLEVQERAYAKMLSVSTKKKFKSSSEKEHFIEEAMMEFESGDIDRREFVKKVSLPNVKWICIFVIVDLDYSL